MRYLAVLLLFIAGCAPRVRLVHFWAPWCVTCAPELEELRKLSALNRGGDLEIIAVATLASDSEIDRFLKLKDYPYTLLHDSSGVLAEKYDVTELPLTLVFDANEQPLEIFDPITEQYSSRIAGARSWVSESMTESLEAALERS